MGECPIKTIVADLDYHDTHPEDETESFRVISLTDEDGHDMTWRVDKTKIFHAIPELEHALELAVHGPVKVLAG